MSQYIQFIDKMFVKHIQNFANNNVNSTLR
jgi:hypothetical protein